MKRPVQYLIANKGLGMSPGKLAAQVAHGAVRSALACDPALTSQWLAEGETKIVLEARDTEHLLLAERYIKNRGFNCYLVIDEGRTEIEPLSSTVLAVELVDKEDPYVQMTFETFKTYKPPKIEYKTLDFKDERTKRQFFNFWWRG